MRVVFIGPPGAGKGTQSIRLAEALGVTKLSTGEVLREARDAGAELGKLAATYLDQGELVPDEVVTQLVAERLTGSDCANGYLFDGFPRTLSQAESLDELLADQGLPLDLALEFVIPEDELFGRLWKRGRSDDSEEVVRQRLRVYAEMTRPLADYYDERGVLRRVDAVGTFDEVYERVMAAVEDRRQAAG